MISDNFSSSESLRFCEDFIGQPPDFPRKHDIVLPKPEAEEIPYEETIAGIREQKRKESRYFKCLSCVYDNGTAICEKRKEDHKVSLSREYNPYSYCVDYKPDWKKVYPDGRLRK